MTRTFNVTGSCDPKIHYMVDISERLKEIKKLVDAGKYFSINRARQYGKTTTIDALAEYLKNDYVIISLDFQLLGESRFKTEHIFAKAFINYLYRTVYNKRNPVSDLDHSIIKQIVDDARLNSEFGFDDMFPMLSELCDTAEKPVVLIIDEVDSAANNQVFLDFLAQLRGYYLKRKSIPTFQSVILAGVTDVKNIKVLLRPDSKHKVNSPWNIAADFPVKMSFNKNDIKGMIDQYEKDHQTGMDTNMIVGLIFDATSGYPFLVSRLCQLLDERIAGTEYFPDKKAAWTKAGYIEAEKILTQERNSLFDSLTGKLTDFPELKTMLKAILFNGLTISCAAGNQVIDIALMYGFIRNANGTVAIANRIFETVLYNLFLSEEEMNSAVYVSAKNLW